MNGKVQFETPENIQVSYQLAGPGTRFIAWFLDSILLWVLSFVILIVVVAASAAFQKTVNGMIGGRNPSNEDWREVGLYFIGVFYLAFSLGSFFYFGLCELLMRGQTPGKRQMQIRVAKADGFALDPLSIFLRSVFRAVDQLPVLWVVPLITEESQRLGDLVAGTVVIADQSIEIGGVREVLAGRKYSESRFQFDATKLARARRQDVEAIEKILDRWGSLAAAQREALLDRLVKALAARLQVESPPDADRLRFLEDFLAAEYRRQHRKLG